MSVGYDDNVFQTPTHGLSAPTQKVQVQETAGSPAGSVQVAVPSGDPSIPDSVQTVQVPAVAPKFRTVTIPGVPAAERIPSWVTRTDAKWDVQFANRRTLFTFDLGGGVDYYWNRPGKKADYTGDLSMVYLRKLTGRAQFTLSLNSSYQSQPDFSQPNTPTSSNVGSYLSTNIKADFSYRLTPRFSTVTSVSYSALTYEEQTQSSDNYATTTYGMELRYLFSPRLTLLGELRYSTDLHSNNAALDTTSYYLLVGGEVTLSRRFSASLRLGDEVQDFTGQGGLQGSNSNNGTGSSPYVEATLNYRLGQGTILQWNGRYGYEEAGAVNTRSIVARSGLQLTQIFSPRLQGVVSCNLLRTTTSTTFDVPDAVAPVASSTTASTTTGTTGATTTPTTAATSTKTPAASTSTHSVTTDAVQDTIDASLGLYYTLDRHWTLNLTYSYTMSIGPESTADYFRQRIFVGAGYQF
ncbi:MAG: DUF3187 family protein [Chthoniobacter sp.]|nr:DUF3187 family protein [Chthoniobacter sp.]